MRMAKWVIETMYTTYLDTIPIKAVIARGGYNPKEGRAGVVVERGFLEPPHELLHMYVPKIVE